MEIKDTLLFGGVFNGKKILITGDTGFKGSWLSIWLCKSGAKVYGYALPSKTTDDNYLKCNLNTVISHRDGDVRNVEDLKKYFNEVNPDFAFHLAAQALVLDSYSNPHETFHTNLMGTVNFFEAVKNTSSVKVAINITSDKCYKNIESEKGYSENNAMGGDDPYSASKGCAELISHSYLKSFFNITPSCKIATVRAGNVIGGGDWAENRIIPDFFRAIMKNKKLIIRNPDAVRPWQHVLEPLSGYLWLCAKIHLEGSSYCGSWNFGPTESNHKTVKELIESLIRKSGKGTYEIPGNKEKPYEANLLKLDVSKAMNYLQWKPVLDFDETISFTVNGYNDELTCSNVYECRTKQINEYVAKAKEQKLIWTK